MISIWKDFCAFMCIKIAFNWNYFTYFSIMKHIINKKNEEMNPCYIFF